MKRIMIFIILGVMMAPPAAMAIKQAELQLSVAFPDPVKAGDKITFQVVILNTGSETWLANRYSIYAEIYDAREKYLAKTDQILGNVAVGSAGMAIIYLPYAIPQDEYEGMYKYRIIVNYENKRILYSDFLSYTVSSIARKEEKAFLLPVKLNGKGMVSYRNSTEENWDSYLWNFNLGLMGQAFDNPMMFKLDSGIATDGFRLNTILLNYRLPALSVSAGDVMPVFSQLAFYNTGVRGFMVEYKPGKIELAGVLASSVFARQGTDTASGSYARYTGGARAGLEAVKDMKFGVSCVYTADAPGSLTDPAVSMAPAKNLVLAADVSCLMFGNFLLDGEYAYSSYSADLASDTAALDDGAYRISFSAMLGDITAGITYKEVGTYFSSLNSSYSISDRAGIEGLLNYSLDFLKIYFMYGRFNDNLSNAPEKVTTAIDNLSSFVTVAFRGFPVCTLGYTWNSLVGNPASLVNNVTRNASIGITHKIWETNISAGYQVAEFYDITDLSSDIISYSGNLRFNRMINNIISLNAGVNYSRLYSIDLPKTDQTAGASAGVNYRLIPEKFIISGFTSVSRRIDDAGTTDNLYINLNVDGTYNISSEMALTVGTGWINSADQINSANSCQSWSLGTRASYSF